MFDIEGALVLVLVGIVGRDELGLHHVGDLVLGLIPVERVGRVGRVGLRSIAQRLRSERPGS